MSLTKKAEGMAIFFHNKYELLAKYYNYKTRADTKIFDKNSPNGKLIIAVCESWIINKLEKLKNK